MADAKSRGETGIGDTELDDTIVAIITPPGEGGVAAIRIAGPSSLDILSKCFNPKTGKKEPISPFLLRLGHFISSGGETLDEVMAVYMPKGKSYTGLDQVEIFCHGGRQVVRLLLDELVGLGARPAEPGEFTKLAFLNGKIDLAGAEAVAELIAANTDSSYKASREHLLGKYSGFVNRIREDLVALLAEVEASIDFAEEDIDPDDNVKLGVKADKLIEEIDRLAQTYRGGRIIQEGFKVAICGRPNAGKSSLFNILLEEERALVNPTAGTTRDYLSEWIDLEGFAVNLVDTAGLRDAGGVIEKAGQSRTEEIIGKSDLVIWMYDVSGRDWEGKLRDDINGIHRNVIMLTANKIDLLCEVSGTKTGDNETVSISCTTREGVGSLKTELVNRINEQMPDLTSGLVVTSARHQQKLTSSLASLKEARDKIADNETPDLIAFELRQATNDLDEITGRVYTEDVLGQIFSTFCVGK